MAHVRFAVVDINFAVVTKCARRTRARAAVDQIVARATISTGIRLAVVDVQFTILPLEAFKADALIRTDQIFAGAAVLARRRFAFVDFLLTVRSGVALMAMAFVRIAEILARSVAAEMFHVDAFANGRIFARHHFDVAQLSRPAGRANAFVCVLTLHAGRAIVAWILRTPIDVLRALFASETIRAMARIIVVVVAARGSILARLRVAFVDFVLAVRAGVAGCA